MHQRWDPDRQLREGLRRLQAQAQRPPRKHRAQVSFKLFLWGNVGVFLMFENDSVFELLKLEDSTFGSFPFEIFLCEKCFFFFLNNN